jgi:acylphosphatase
MDIKRYNITIRGKVQRVGFRFSAMEAAYRYSIRGNVMNMGADAVYIEAEGTGESLDRFVAWCRKGPMGSRVDSVEIEEGMPEHFRTFEITGNRDSMVQR